MRNSLKKGERITTIGGLVGRIVQVNDATVVFETSEDRVRIEVAKWGHPVCGVDGAGGCAQGQEG